MWKSTLQPHLNCLYLNPLCWCREANGRHCIAVQIPLDLTDIRVMLVLVEYFQMNAFCLIVHSQTNGQWTQQFECSPLQCFLVQVKKEETGTIHVIKQRQLHLSCDIISLNVSNQLKRLGQFLLTLTHSHRGQDCPWMISKCLRAVCFIQT